MSNSPDHQNGRENGRDNGRDNGREDRNDYNGDGRFRRRRRRGRRRPYDNGDQQQQGTATIQQIKLEVPEDKTIVIGITGEPGAGKSALAKSSLSWAPASSMSMVPVTKSSNCHR